MPLDCLDQLSPCSNSDNPIPSDSQDFQEAFIQDTLNIDFIKELNMEISDKPLGSEAMPPVSNNDTSLGSMREHHTIFTEMSAQPPPQLQSLMAFESDQAVVSSMVSDGLSLLTTSIQMDPDQGFVSQLDPLAMVEDSFMSDAHSTLSPGYFNENLEHSSSDHSIDEFSELFSYPEPQCSNMSYTNTTVVPELIERPKKALKVSPDNSPGSSPPRSPKGSIVGLGFDADGANKDPIAKFMVFGSDLSKEVKEKYQISLPTNASNSVRIQESHHDVKPIKQLSLSLNLPSKKEGMELTVVTQPESQHRARYLTEGSRGCVKDESQHGFPTLKLIGCKKTVTLQIFVANDSGKVKPHGFYQACKVTGRNNMPCEEIEFEGTNLIENQWDVSEGQEFNVDNVGILKLRNSDVEQRDPKLIYPRSRKKSTKCRLVFRVLFDRDDGGVTVLQCVSSTISCTQPTGAPEIIKKSLTSCSAKGGEELYVIGKNFVKNTSVKLQETCNGQVIWEQLAPIDRECFHQTHLVCTIPPYKDHGITSDVAVSLVISAGCGRSSDPQPFTYTPVICGQTGSSTFLITETNLVHGGYQQPAFSQQNVSNISMISQMDTPAGEVQGTQNINNNDTRSFADTIKQIALMATNNLPSPDMSMHQFGSRNGGDSN